MSRRVRNWRSNQFSSSHRNRELNFYCFSRTRKKFFLKWRFPTISLQVKVLFYFMCFKNPCEFELNWLKLVWVSIHFIYSLLSSMKINCPVIFLNQRNKKNASIMWTAYQIWIIDQTCSVMLAGYWSSSFFFFARLWTEAESRTGPCMHPTSAQNFTSDLNFLCWDLFGPVDISGKPTSLDL